MRCKIKARTVKIATFNINNIDKRLENLLAWLAQFAPDVVCLRELKAAQEKFPADSLRAVGYEAVWQGERSWNGVAILARGHPPVLVRSSLSGKPRGLCPNAGSRLDLRRSYPNGPLWTFWDYKRERWPADKGMRLDHFLLSAVVAERLVDGGVDRRARGEENASDRSFQFLSPLGISKSGSLVERMELADQERNCMEGAFFAC